MLILERRKGKRLYIAKRFVVRPTIFWHNEAAARMKFQDLQEGRSFESLMRAGDEVNLSHKFNTGEMIKILACGFRVARDDRFILAINIGIQCRRGLRVEREEKRDEC